MPFITTLLFITSFPTIVLYDTCQSGGFSGVDARERTGQVPFLHLRVSFCLVFILSLFVSAFRRD